MKERNPLQSPQKLQGRSLPVPFPGEKLSHPAGKHGLLLSQAGRVASVEAAGGLQHCPLEGEARGSVWITPASGV